MARLPRARRWGPRAALAAAASAAASARPPRCAAARPAPRGGAPAQRAGHALHRRRLAAHAAAGAALLGAAAPARCEAPAPSLRERLLPGAALANPRSSAAAADAQEPSVYPSWLFGEWEVRSRPVAFGEPLGARFVDAETRRAIRGDVEAGAEVAWRSRFYWASLDEAGVPVPQRRPGPARGAGAWGVYAALPPEGAHPAAAQGAAGRGQWRLAQAGAPQAGAPAAAPGPVVQFRAFNAAQEVRAFLGRGGRQVIGEGDPRERPVRVLVAYPVEEGGVELVRTVRLRLDAARGERAGEDTFLSSELFRQVTATDDDVDDVGDFEVINQYQLLDAAAGRVGVRNRVAKYLVPGDPLYGEAAGRAVSWADYDWQMRRVGTCIGTPYGEQCDSRRPPLPGSRAA